MASRAHQPQALAALLSTLPSLPRPLLARLTARLIERLDQIDGDPDFEETDAEDSFMLSWYASGESGPGCPVSDPDYCVDDIGEQEQMSDDAPNLPVWTIEPGPDGKRFLIERNGGRWIGSPL